MTSQKVVLVTDYTWDSTDAEAEVLRSVGAVVLEAKEGSEEELLRLVPDVVAILTCFATVPASVIRAGRRLEVVGRYGIGVDNIDVAEATRLGIPVTNVPAYCLDEVSDHALALLLACARNIYRYSANIRAGDWSLRTDTNLYRLRGRTLGIVGFGKIGRTLAAKARAFGLRVLASDEFIDASTVQPELATLVSLEVLLRESDFVSLHTPLTAETAHLIDRIRLRLMKPSAYLINTSRGGVIDHEDLLVALQDGWIAGAALDVFEPERLPRDHPLLAQPNLIATPHAAFYSEESVQDLRVQAASNVAAILAGKLPGSVVNPEVLRLPRWSQLGHKT